MLHDVGLTLKRLNGFRLVGRFGTMSIYQAQDGEIAVAQISL